MSTQQRNASPSHETFKASEVPRNIASIYFDTNALEVAWPGISKVIEGIALAAGELGLSVHIPEPVLRELAAHWPQRFSDARNSLRVLSAAGVIEAVEVPDLPQAQISYERSVREVLAKYNVTTTPLPCASCDDLFDYAIRQDLAFENEGKNFQDTVIVLSIIEHILSTGKTAGVLVSSDRVFTRKSAVLKAFCDKQSVRLLVMSPDEVLSWLKGRQQEIRPMEPDQPRTVMPEDSISLSDSVVIAVNADNTTGKPTLKLEAMSWFRNVSEGSQRVIQYRVVAGLPPESQAWIAYFGHEGWRILREIHGVQGHWHGNYESAEEAIAALQDEIAQE